jgi:hypothetical protein
MSPGEAFRSFHGVHAQNYHIFTPAPERDWAFVWGCQPSIKELPWANAAYDCRFQRGEGEVDAGVLDHPFDYAQARGPGQAVVSDLRENRVIGMSWAVLDYDNDAAAEIRRVLESVHKTMMYGMPRNCWRSG